MAEGWKWRGYSGKDLEESEDEDHFDENGNRVARFRVSLAKGVDRVEQNQILAQAGNEPVVSSSRDSLTDSLRDSQKARIADLLDRWEEPEVKAATPERISINAIIEFRKALAFMDPVYPFTTAFGLADSRENCVEAAQEVYRRLLLDDVESGILDFSILASLCRDGEDGELDPERVKDLIRIFRPNREGKLTMVEFVRSVDDVYKSLKMLRAAIVNASQIDNAFESLINIGFYFLVGCAVLAVFRIDPFALFVSASGIIISFSFLVGAASSKYFEGLLFIFARRPYDIGDRISISDPMNDTPAAGSATWFVEKVDLFTTTLRFATTNEVCTVSNGSLANARIVNAARSPQAVLYLNLKFSVKVPYSKVKVFRKTVEAFVKARPREWLAFSGFRANRVEADMGYIEYVIVIQHRESWQEIGRLLDSRATLYSFCLEVQKKLGMNYKAPAVPVDLSLSRDVAAAARSIQQVPSTEYSEESGPFNPAAGVVGHRSLPSGLGVSVKDIAALFSSGPNEDD
uniref:Mechanosensitive ion channel MscS domain-containing protein n=1 Tax=Grammatophora oceanica TaxID=210454 RepID=A0A7S1YKQ8_9STRA